MKLLRVILIFIAMVTSVRADVISDWNDKGLRAVYNSRLTNFPEIADVFAILNVAIFDAVNAVERRYDPYLFNDPVPLGASTEAAVTGAAYTVLIKVFPEQAAIFSNARETALSRIKETTKRLDGFLIGEQVARATLKARYGQNVFNANLWRPETIPGKYIPTTLPVAPSLATAKPWLIASPNRFRPVPPPNLESDIFARDYNETRESGGLVNNKRTADQTQAAKFWAMSGVHAWNRALSQVIPEHQTFLLEHARIRALMNMALADSFIAAWEAKYYYQFWRPLTAIRNGDRTGNPNTPIDLGWLPLLETPLHPEYPSGHSSNLGAAMAVLDAFSDRLVKRPIEITSEDSPGVVRRFSNIQEMGAEIADARIWAGIHFRTACSAGRDLGEKIGTFGVQNYLRPANKRSTP